MKDFLLKKKWIGLFSIIIVSLLFAFNRANVVSDAYNDAEPVIANEAGHFFPVGFEGGQIVYPKNTVIERTYGLSENPYKVVLNTEVDDLNISELSSGIYFTRNKIYYVDLAKGETKIQSMEKFPDVEITRDDLNEFLEDIGEYLKPALFLIVFVFISFYIAMIALFGTIAMNWFFKKTYNADFALTLRVNILVSVALFLLGVYLEFSLGLISTLLIMAAGNYLANILLENKTPKMS